MGMRFATSFTRAHSTTYAATITTARPSRHRLRKHRAKRDDAAANSSDLRPAPPAAAAKTHPKNPPS